MNIESVREYCIAKKGITETTPFGDDYLVIKVMDKMFILINLDNSANIVLKCDPEYAIELREQHNGIEGAFHFNKKYWNQITLDGRISDHLIKQLIDHSYNEVVKKFTKKLRTEYEALS